ncbi:ABC transporter substrate-binding protein [Paenibacillus glycanilyticus]|uniref:ABC transporter substrate-binding protein n=1 Tax=Paenibacillus glycanilyticus TaxID=126569 RepID=UPI00203A4032|nr:ABC transporter substrate-binding protein [Paenibacillus glycanilyticus]MCM3631084.1 ABC transporter substrate-binding protein [Paenibacillus glycanilyticus]
MKILDYYEKLHNRYAANADFQAFSVPIDEIAEVLDCTRRNTQLVLQRLSAELFIQWKPGRGRGNQSEIKFLVTRQELLQRKVHELIGKESIKEAWQLIASLDEMQKHEFMRWINMQFGIQTDEDELDILRFPYYREVSLLDPATVLRSSDLNWLRQLMNKLVEYSTKEKKLLPKLAHHWESDANCKKWTFYLRKGVRFHDGHILSPHDIVHTFKRILTKSPSDWLSLVIADIYASSKHSVTFELTESIVAFPNMICTDRCYIVPKGWEGEHPSMPVGTGPFRIVKNNSSILVLEAHEHYFEGRPHLDRIEMWVWPNYEGLPTETTSEQNVQLLYNEAYLNQEAGNHERTTLQELEHGSNYVIFNQIKPGPLQDIRLRQAIHFGLDRWEIIGGLNGSRVMPASGFIFTEESESKQAHYNITKAKELLAASSYKGEILQLYTYDNPSNRENAAWIQIACEKLGIQVQIKVLQVEQLVDTAVMTQADMISVGEVLGEQPDITLIETYRAGNSLIRNLLPSEWKKTIDARISYCLRVPEQSGRLAVLRNLQHELKKSFCLLFLHQHMRVIGHQNSLRGITMNVWGKVDFKDVWRRPQ